MASVCQGHFKVNAFVFHYHLVTCSQRTKAGGARATQYEKPKARRLVFWCIFSRILKVIDVTERKVIYRDV